MIDQIKKVRVQLDGYKELMKIEMQPEHCTRHAYDNILLGKAWLGKVLGVLGEESPYPKDGSRHNVEDIEETADTSELSGEGKIMYASNNVVLRDAIMQDTDWLNLNQIEKIDWLRQELQTKIAELIKMECFNSAGERTRRYIRLAYQKVMEARFWLGFELEHIKEHSKQQQS